jgi:hypothetical protein
LSYKIKVDTSKLKANYDKFKKEAIRDIHRNIGGYILGNIAASLSPVEGFRKFQKYSDLYLKEIKRSRGFGVGKSRSPVNLYLSGQLIKSFKAVIKGDRVNIRFDNEKFVYHNNEGAGKSKVKRRMLPTEQGEKFNKQITISIKESLSRLIQKIFTR